MAEAELTGGCLCGAVRYRVVRALEADVCYCADCARAVGSPVTVWVRCAADDFRFIRGAPVRFASSPGVTRCFCGHCGTSLSYHYADGRHVDVTTASLDDPLPHAPGSEGPGRPDWLGPLVPRRAPGRTEDG